MSLETYFETLIAEISPSQKKISQASISHNYIREYIDAQSKSGAFFPIVETFLTGSYSRHTKIEPLDDVDMFIVINGDGARTGFFNDSTILPMGQQSPWRYFTDEYGAISSIKVLNLLKDVVRERYPQSTAIKRDGQVINVYLKSYNLGLDIVPAFRVSNFFGSHYYLIPEGHNYTGWIKTNPVLDAQIVQSLNNKHNNKFRGLVKLIKHWNTTCNDKRLRNYHIEAIAINIFSNIFFLVNSYYSALQKYFDEMGNYIFSCPDHTEMSKSISSNLNTYEMAFVQSEILKARFLLNNNVLAFMDYLEKWA